MTIQLIIIILTIIELKLIGKKWKYVWYLAIFTNLFYTKIYIDSGLYGMLVLNIIYYIMYADNLLKWNKDLTLKLNHAKIKVLKTLKNIMKQIKLKPLGDIYVPKKKKQTRWGMLFMISVIAVAFYLVVTS